MATIRVQQKEFEKQRAVKLVRSKISRDIHDEIVSGLTKISLMTQRVKNAIAPAFIAISIGVANAILIESYLSFIGVGVPADTITWGSLINSGRGNLSA